MKVLYLLLYILAAVCFALSAFFRNTVDANTPGRGVNLVAAGLFFWVLVPLLVTVQAVDD